MNVMIDLYLVHWKFNSEFSKDFASIWVIGWRSDDLCPALVGLIPNSMMNFEY